MSTLEPARSIDLPVYADEAPAVRETIQPHGIVAVVAPKTLTIECISDNVGRLLGIPGRKLCGAPLATIVDAADADDFSATLREPRLAGLNPHDLTLRGAGDKRLRVQCTAHRAGAGTILEFEEPAADAAESGWGDAQAPIERLTTAVDISTLVTGATRDIREVCGFDRALAYRFDADGRVEVVAEATAAGVAPRYAGAPLAMPTIPDSLRRFYLRSPLRLIPDTHYRPAHLITADGHAEPTRAEFARVVLGGVSPDVLDRFARTGSRATMTISIVIRGRLWGLIACHHGIARRVDYRKRAICELIGHLLAWQLDTRLEHGRRSERARVKALEDELATALEGADDVAAAAIDAAPRIFELFAADGVAVCSAGTIRRAGAVPREDAALRKIAAALDAHVENGVAGAHGGRMALYVRLAADGTDFLLIFRSLDGRPRPWSGDDKRLATHLRARMTTRLAAQAQRDAERVRDVGQYLGSRNAQAAALIKLHEDVAAVLPSRAAVTNVILEFARRETAADGSALETLTDAAVVCEAATGLLEPLAGQRLQRAGSVSGNCVDFDTPVLCRDALREAGSADYDAFRQLGIASLIAVPVAVCATETVVLKVAAVRPGAFGADDIQALKLAATNLRTALRAAHEVSALADAEKEQRDYARRLRALHAIASTTRSNRKDQIDAALQLGMEQLDVDWAFLGVIDEAHHELVIENSVGRDGTLGLSANLRLPLDGTLIGGLAQSSGVQIVPDVSLLPEGRGDRRWSSLIAAPLLIAGSNYGIIGFLSREVRSHGFSEANFEFAAVAGELISSAIERGLQRERLETSETRYRALTEAIPEMVCVVDERDRFEYVNARWTAYTGLTLEGSRKLGAAAIVHAEQLPLIESGRGALPPAEFDCEARLRRSDGAYRWHLMRSVPFHDAAGAAGKWLVTATDIEERKAAEAVMADVHDAALAATEAKSRFLATMSHEIRTPMNAVIGMTELLLLTQLSDEQREYIEIVRDSGQSLLRVLNDILDYSKIEAGKLELETVEFDLPGQIESVVELLRAQYQIKGVALTTAIASHIPTTVAGDPGRLRQILLNLAGNALKFTAAGGSVHIDVAAAEQRGESRSIRFTIKDTGIGIAPDVVRRLFQPFSQGDESTTRKYGGTGLGLSICAQLVSLMNGSIGVQSVPGEGSAFWFEIPLHATKNSARTPDPRKRGVARSKPVVMRAERILLVEDNEINSFLALKQLQRIGFVVSAVNNGLQAVEAVGREQFDLVFMDCHMPEMDGFAATREIRRLEAGGTRHLPIVAMTADARTEDHQNCLRAGMDDYVSKPTSLESLRLVLDRWLPATDRRQNSRVPTSGTSPAATLRVAKLLELFGGDRAAVITLLTAAAGSIKADLSRIDHCVATQEYGAVAEAAHRLKGTSASIRSPLLGEISAAVEEAALEVADGEAAAIPDALLAELRAAVDALTSDVEKHSKVLETIG